MATAHHCKPPKQPRQVVYHGVTYKSINAFYKYALSLGCKIKFGSIRYALDNGRDLDEVLAGKKFEKKVAGFSVEWKGVSYPSYRALYRALYKKSKKVYLTPEGFRSCVHTHGLETAVDHLLHKRLTDCMISKRLGGSQNLVLLRLKHGWSRHRAITEPCNKKRKRHG